jgi:hypothetical protein
VPYHRLPPGARIVGRLRGRAPKDGVWSSNLLYAVMCTLYYPKRGLPSHSVPEGFVITTTFTSHGPTQQETRTGRDCQFCRHFDPEFGKRDPMDRLVCPELEDTAGAHMMENGRISLRLLEIRMRLGPVGYAA